MVKSAEMARDRGTLEIQAYDELCFPGLAAEWRGRWPFVGALTLQLPTAADDEVESWISAGAPPIYFGFGSMPVRSATDTVAMISAACAELGERALICSAPAARTSTKWGSHWVVYFPASRIDAKARHTSGE